VVSIGVVYLVVRWWRARHPSGSSVWENNKKSILLDTQASAAEHSTRYGAGATSHPRFTGEEDNAL